MFSTPWAAAVVLCLETIFAAVTRHRLPHVPVLLPLLVLVLVLIGLHSPSASLTLGVTGSKCSGWRL